jgi:hypothetical protein
VVDAKARLNDTFVAVRRAAEASRYPVGHQGHHLPGPIEIEFESNIVIVPRTSAEELLHELRRLLR